MAQAQQPKLYRSFVKGLITEASYLTYPEDASTDELNTIPSRKGNRTRRLGINYEDNFVLNTVSLNATDVVNEYVWKAVNNDANVNFLVVQLGSVLKFFDLNSDPVSDSLLSFSVDLATYAAPSATTTSISSSDCQFTVGKGYLFVANPYIEPLVIEYNTSDGSISVVPIIIQIRDFDGVNDNLANDAEPTTLSKEHQYNLMNQGWVTPGQYTVPGGVSPDIDPGYYDRFDGSFNFY